MENTCKMQSCNSAWPTNIDTADTLIIESGCRAVDAYQLFCDRPNIKFVIVSGNKYTHQEIRNMPMTDSLGGSRLIATDLPDPVPWIETVPPTPADHEQTATEVALQGEVRRRLEEYNRRQGTRGRPILAQVNQMREVATGGGWPHIFEEWVQANPRATRNPVFGDLVNAPIGVADTYM